MTNHLTTATAIYEAFGRGDIPTILSHMADDIKWEQWADNTAQQAGVPWLQARHGKAGSSNFFKCWAAWQSKNFRCYRSWPVAIKSPLSL